MQELDPVGKLAETGRAPQGPYSNKEVWHNLDSLKKSVAEELKIGPELFGPNRKNNDFNRRLLEAICKLRKDGLVSDWDNSNWKSAFRLADPNAHKEVYVPPPILDVTSPQYDRPSLISFGEEVEMKRIFGAIMGKRGKKDNTYKFALMKIILDHCKDRRSRVVRYDHLADEFLKHYWYQKYTYGIKQDFKTEREPEVIGIMRDVFGDGKNLPADFDQLDKSAVKTAKKEILRKIFGHARKKTSDVVPRLQNIKWGDGDTVEYNIFYKYDDDAQMIWLRPEAHDFFQRNYPILSTVVIAHWAKFLERINENKYIPRLVSKVEAPDKKRGSMIRYYKVLNNHEKCCFYCRTVLERDYTHVDHFIPWSYIFNNDLWNLVLACQTCNLKKRNHIPCDEFRDSLILRNRKYYNVVEKVRTSLDDLGVKGKWESEIDNHYEMCLKIGLSQITLP